jgi:hypothetical protein
MPLLICCMPSILAALHTDPITTFGNRVKHGSAAPLGARSNVTLLRLRLRPSATSSSHAEARSMEPSACR